MGKRVSKSRTFAVLLANGETFGIWFLWREIILDDARVPRSTKLEADSLKTTWSLKERDNVIELLVKTGTTVRYYDPEEKQWMDHSRQYGLVRAPGNRDGSWGIPRTLQMFEEDYLKSM